MRTAWAALAVFVALIVFLAGGIMGDVVARSKCYELGYRDGGGVEFPKWSPSGRAGRCYGERGVARAITPLDSLLRAEGQP